MTNLIETVKEELESLVNEAKARRDEAAKALQEAETEVSSLEERLLKFLDVFPELCEPSARREKPAKAVAAPKTQKVKKVSTGKKATTGVMIASMQQVMGDEVMTAGQVADALKAADLAPESKNLSGYISSVFGAAKDADGELLFVRVARGQYQVAGAQPAVVAAEIEAAPVPEMAPAEKEPENPAEALLRASGVTLSSLGLV